MSPDRNGGRQRGKICYCGLGISFGRSKIWRLFDYLA